MSYKVIYTAVRQSTGRARQCKTSVGQSHCLGRNHSARQSRIVLAEVIRPDNQGLSCKHPFHFGQTILLSWQMTSPSVRQVIVLAEDTRSDNIFVLQTSFGKTKDNCLDCLHSSLSNPSARQSIVLLIASSFGKTKELSWQLMNALGKTILDCRAEMI